jgi:hypothetical protein
MCAAGRRLARRLRLTRQCSSCCHLRRIRAWRRAIGRGRTTAAVPRHQRQRRGAAVRADHCRLKATGCAAARRQGAPREAAVAPTRAPPPLPARIGPCDNYCRDIPTAESPLRAQFIVRVGGSLIRADLGRPRSHQTLRLVADYAFVQPSRLRASTSCRICQPSWTDTRRSISTLCSMIETSILSRLAQHHGQRRGAAVRPHHCRLEAPGRAAAPGQAADTTIGR